MSKTHPKIGFVSTLDCAPWGGSEVLWSEAALRLRNLGCAVTASVCHWPQRAAALNKLAEAGVTLHERQFSPRNWRGSLRSMVEPFTRRAAVRSFNGWLRREQPDLVCVSQGSIADDQFFAKQLARSGCPYTILIQANAEWIWPDDQRADFLREFFRQSRHNYFVSQGNRELLETQLAISLTRASVVRNPFNVNYDANVAWPEAAEPVRLACVGRLEPGTKGQDLLLRVLARESWRARPWQLSLFGQGNTGASMQRLTRMLGLEDRVKFCGQVPDLEKVWATHHALVLPSRAEGLPLAMVEAMLCARPVIVTDVAGNAEVLRDGATGFVAEAPTVRHLNAALERAWQQRENWQGIGHAAARSIREFVPRDPALEFARQLLALANERPGKT